MYSHLKEDLVSFVIKTLQEIDPGTPYMHNWHIELICDYLIKLYKGEITRLIINVPPRSLKSICASVAFPAWVLANNPCEKILAISYSQVLSIKHSTDCRKIMQSNWYNKTFNTRIKKGENEKRKFVTTKNGYRFATSVNGTLTGEGGNIIIIDDPHNPATINRKSEREKVISWFESVLMSRLNNKKEGKILIIMQRLHVNDLSGYLMAAKSQWNVLSIPAISENDEVYKIQEKIHKIRAKNEILHANRDSKADVMQLMKELGSHTFSAQYQQNPISDQGGIVKKEWFCEYSSVCVKSKYLSIDTASGQNFNNDYSVIMEIGLSESNFYILDIIREKFEYPQIKNKIIEMSKANNYDAILIEDRNLGSSLIQELKNSAINIIKIVPYKDKISRVISILNILESRKVLLPDLGWKNDFIKEITSFPKALHDDQVDCLSQFLNWHTNRTNLVNQPRIRML